MIRKELSPSPAVSPQVVGWLTPRPLLVAGWLVLMVVLLLARVGRTQTPGEQLFFSDIWQGTITRVDLTTLTSGVVVRGLIAPEGGTCLSAQGHIFFAEPKEQRITRFRQDGTGATLILNPDSGILPEGLSFDSADNLFFCQASQYYRQLLRRLADCARRPRQRA